MIDGTDEIAVASGHVLGRDHGVDDRLVDAFHHRAEDRVECPPSAFVRRIEGIF